MRRLGIFSFSDSDGVLDKYVIFMLGNMRDHLDKIICVAHSGISSKWRPVMERLCSVIIEPAGCRTEFDAYIRGLRYALKYRYNYDEILFFSDRLIGPLGSPEDMFSSAEAENCDAWSYAAEGQPEYRSLIALKKSVYEPDRIEAECLELSAKSGLGYEQFRGMFSILSDKWYIYLPCDISDYHAAVNAGGRLLFVSMDRFSGCEGDGRRITDITPRECFEILKESERYEESFVTEYLYRVKGVTFVSDSLGRTYFADDDIYGKRYSRICILWVAENSDISVLTGFSDSENVLAICENEDISQSLSEQIPDMRSMIWGKTKGEAVSGRLLSSMIGRYEVLLFAEVPPRDNSTAVYLFRMFLNSRNMISGIAEDLDIVIPAADVSDRTDMIDAVAVRTSLLKTAHLGAGKDLSDEMMKLASDRAIIPARLTDRRLDENTKRKAALSEGQPRSSEKKDPVSDGRYKDILKRILTADDKKEIRSLRKALMTKGGRKELYDRIFGDADQ